MVKTTLLCLVLIMKMLHSDAIMGGSCGSLRDTENNPPNVMVPGSNISFTAHGASTCTTVLVYRNQPDAELQVLHQQRQGRIYIPLIYMNTSGLYCTYRNCTSRQTDWCCIKVTVPTKMQIQFPESPQQDTEEFGICSASAWPRPLENEMIVESSNKSCPIKMLSVRYTDIYTTVLIFIININSSCRSIICATNSMLIEKYINTPHVTDPTTPTTEDKDITNSTTETPTVHINSTHHQCGGALRMHRTTLWTIVIAVLSIGALCS